MRQSWQIVRSIVPLLTAIAFADGQIPAKAGTAIPPSCSLGEAFFKTDAPPGQNLYGCTSPNAWSLMGGTTGAGTASLGDFAASNLSASVQTLGTSCSKLTPCQIRTGSVVFTMTAPITGTLTGTNTGGTVFWYLSSSQVLTAGHNSAVTLTCSAGCTVVTGIPAFPTDATPLWQTTFTAKVWDVINPATMDKRAFLSRNVIAPGPGVSTTSDPTTGIQTLSTDPTIVPRYFVGSGAPASNCTAGRDLYIDTSGAHLYFCSSTNTWTQAH